MNSARINVQQGLSHDADRRTLPGPHLKRRRALIDKGLKPGDAQLAAALGDSFHLWTDLKAAVAAEHGPVVEEWKYYGPKSGWTMKIVSYILMVKFLLTDL